MARWLVSGLVLGAMCLALVADDPKPADLAKKPQWQRMLSGEDAKTAAKLEKLIQDLETTDDYEAAVESASDLVALRTKAQGADHYEVVNTKFELATLRKVAALKAGPRNRWRVIKKAWGEASQLEGKARYAEAQQIREQILDGYRKVLGEDHPGTAICNSNVAANMANQGKAAEAVPLYRKALDIRRKSLGEEHPYTADSYNILAYCLEDLGKGAEAVPLYQKALDIRRKTLGEEHLQTADSYNNLALNLDRQGRHIEAEPLFRNALDIYRKVLGEDHLNTATGYSNLATNLDNLGKAAEAGPLHWKALDIRRKVLGEDHPHIAVSYTNLAVHLSEQGKGAEAHPLLEKALDIYRRLHGEGHLDTASGYSNLAFNLTDQGKATEAEPLFRKALDIRRKLLGEDHPVTAGSYDSLASNLADLGKTTEAGILYQKALEIRRKVYGENHRNTAESYSNLAVHLNQTGNSAEAGSLHQKALDIRLRLLGENHPSTASSYANLAANLDSQGKGAEAEPLHQKALDIRRTIHGEFHPKTAISYNNVAANLNNRGKAAEAEPLYRKALDIKLKLFGEMHPETAAGYSNLAYNLLTLGRAEEAKPLLVKALDISRKILGEDHPHTAHSYNNLAGNLAASGRAKEAEPLYQKALNIKLRVYGEGHPDTAVGYTNLATNCFVQQDTAGAEVQLLRAIAAYEASRLTAATGFDRAGLNSFNPRLFHAAILAPRDPSAAWGTAELTFARSLLEHQNSASSHLTAAERADTDAAFAQLTVSQSQLLKLITKSSHSAIEAAQLSSLLAERRRAEERLTALTVAVNQRLVTSIAAFQTAMANDAALIFWVDVDNRSGTLQEHWGCVVRASGPPHWERLTGTGPDGKWLPHDTGMARRLREALNGLATFAEVADLARSLHKQRISPLVQHLVGVKTLHVVAVNDMADVPVEVLTADYRISYVPSGTYLARNKDRPPLVKEGLLALGDPVLPEKTTTVPPPLPAGGLLVTFVAPGGAGEKTRLQSGDVLLKYADQELSSLDDLTNAIAANEKTKTNTLTIWRNGKSNTKDVSPGKLGVILDLEPAPQAIAARRKTTEMLAQLHRGGDWAELPGTAAELKGLQTLFPQNTILTRNNANPTKLAELVKADKLKEFRYLHFATHGEANSVMAFQSSLILHGDDKSVARLTAREILDTWKLNAELVTLSACETAIGKEGGGDGLLGFAQAFLTAGARSVCLSLWKVDDAATALLMDRFYRNLLGKRDGLDKPMPKALALDEAKRWLRTLSTDDAATRLATISKGVSRGAGAKAIELAPPKPPAEAKPDGAKKPFDHPKYWAAFILIGDPN